jgi:hypothetical protein
MTTKITDKNISNIANKFIQWQSVITADGSTSTNATAGQGYFIDTTSNTHTINLPSSPSIGDSVAIKDYAGTFATNNLTIGRNGSNIQGAANDSLISSNRASLTLVYVDSTRGWVYSKESNVADLQAALFITATGGTITTSGNFKIHSFTGDGCFVISCGGNSVGSNTVDYLVVAGGGGGAGTDPAGGGGAGGYRTNYPSCDSGLSILASTYPITVGAGGSGGSAWPGTTGTRGSNSVFSTITSTGGGAGAGNDCGTIDPEAPGGSGGGGGRVSSPSGFGAGNTPPVSPPQGNPGGYGLNLSSPGPNTDFGGGGGGASANGGPAIPSRGGNGGAGSPNSITGSSVTYSGGGSGGKRSTYGTGGSGGAGGGGGTCGSGGSGSSNTGGGGSGGYGLTSPSPPYSPGDDRAGFSGGSGIVIIRYKFQ